MRWMTTQRLQGDFALPRVLAREIVVEQWLAGPAMRAAAAARARRLRHAGEASPAQAGGAGNTTAPQVPPLADGPLS